MMAPIHSILIYLSGVLLTSVFESVKRVIPDYEKWDYSKKCELRDLSAKLSMGKISSEDFLARISDENKQQQDSGDLLRKIMQHIHFDEQVMNVISEIGAKYPVLNICDYPSDWANSLMEKFSPNFSFLKNAVFTDQLSLKDLQLDLLIKTLQKTGLSSEVCLWVDAFEPRTMRAVANRMHAVIFVDARRLRREFFLRDMLSREKE